jgi:hypothetical protein
MLYVVQIDMFCLCRHMYSVCADRMTLSAQIDGLYVRR